LLTERRKPKLTVAGLLNELAMKRLMDVFHAEKAYAGYHLRVMHVE
jgi:hypothetical protein